MRHGAGIGAPDSGRIRVDPASRTGFRVAQTQDSRARQIDFEPVAHGDGDDIVFAPDAPQRVLAAGVGEIAEQKHDRPAPLRSQHDIESGRQMGAAIDRLVVQNVAQQPLPVPHPLPGRDAMFDTVSGDEQPDAVAVSDGRERQDGRQVRNDAALGDAAAAEIDAGAGVHQE